MAGKLIDSRAPHTPHTHGGITPQAPFVGCAGWGQISGTPLFSTMEGSQLERYASLFSAVEINSSFYRAHRQTTYAKWAASVPPNFRFSVKLLRTITHASQLTRIDALLEQFASETSGLGVKLGCVLVQLPPSLRLDRKIADDFFGKMRANFTCMLACEARHPSWFDADATEILKAHAITRVMADPPKGQIGDNIPTTPATYRRLHGSPRIYYSSYSQDYLARLSTDLTNSSHPESPAWVIFDNTASGAAVGNAMTVQEAVALNTAA